MPRIFDNEDNEVDLTSEAYQIWKNATDDNPALKKTIENLPNDPLRQSAVDRLNRSLKSGMDDQQLAELVLALYLDDHLCLVHEDGSTQEPHIVCSLGLFKAQD